MSAIPWSASRCCRRAPGAPRRGYRLRYVRFAGIAETGTLMLLSDRESPTTLNFLPEGHLVVLPTERIVGSYEDAWQRLRASSATASCRASSMDHRAVADRRHRADTAVRCARAEAPAYSSRRWRRPATMTESASRRTGGTEQGGRSALAAGGRRRVDVAPNQAEGGPSGSLIPLRLPLGKRAPSPPGLGRRSPPRPVPVRPRPLPVELEQDIRPASTSVR